MFITKNQYDYKYKLTFKTTELSRKLFQVGTKVLYFVGDRQVSQRKWRQRWTGPWMITTRTGDSYVTITDTENNTQKEVTLDRLKVFNDKTNDTDFVRWTQYYDEYKRVQIPYYYLLLLLKHGCQNQYR